MGFNLFSIIQSQKLVCQKYPYIAHQLATAYASLLIPIRRAKSHGKSFCCTPSSIQKENKKGHTSGEDLNQHQGLIRIK
jgi:hypothetical protein